MIIDLLKCETHHTKNNYLDNLVKNGFPSTLTKRTRITSTSATLVDNIYMNNTVTAGKSGITKIDLADQFSTFYYSQAQKTKHFKIS